MRAELALTITQVRRHKEFALAADFHAHQALVPTFDHPAGADYTLEWFAALVGGVERAAIFEKSVILGGDQRTFDHFLAVTQLNIFDHQFVAHHSPRLTGLLTAGFAENHSPAGSSTASSSDSRASR